ncbi:MAG: hypothetical protein ACLFQX_04910 [Candidatus Kapaibacterium sp.]
MTKRHFIREDFAMPGIREIADENYPALPHEVAQADRSAASVRLIGEFAAALADKGLIDCDNAADIKFIVEDYLQSGAATGDLCY